MTEEVISLPLCPIYCRGSTEHSTDQAERILIRKLEDHISTCETSCTQHFPSTTQVHFSTSWKET